MILLIFILVHVPLTLLQLVDEDAVLARTPLTTLSRTELLEACLDRAIARCAHHDSGERYCKSTEYCVCSYTHEE